MRTNTLSNNGLEMVYESTQEIGYITRSQWLGLNEDEKKEYKRLSVKKQDLRELYDKVGLDNLVRDGLYYQAVIVYTVKKMYEHLNLGYLKEPLQGDLLTDSIHDTFISAKTRYDSRNNDSKLLEKLKGLDEFDSFIRVLNMEIDKNLKRTTRRTHFKELSLDMYSNEELDLIDTKLSEYIATERDKELAEIEFYNEWVGHITKRLTKSQRKHIKSILEKYENGEPLSSTERSVIHRLK